MTIELIILKDNKDDPDERISPVNRNIPGINMGNNCTLQDLLTIYFVSTKVNIK
jgi:hypothetical protein